MNPTSSHVGIRSSQQTPAADSASFNDSDFIGLVVTDDYKPTVSGTTVTIPNPLIYKIVTTDSEEAQQIVRNQSLVALDSDEKVAYRQSLTFDKRILFQQLVTDGYYDSVENSLATGEPISASWDASSGAAFDWSTDKLASRGIRTVTREAEGTYRVYFSNPMPDSNWTAVTGVGADDYSGAGGSPRQLTVLRTGDNVSPNYVTVHCERTDDAVNEDNAYMSVMVAYPSSTSSTEVAWNNQTSVTPIRLYWSCYTERTRTERFRLCVIHGYQRHELLVRIDRHGITSFRTTRCYSHHGRVRVSCEHPVGNVY